ncbi:GNAT family N-acetyltransferase [Crassaminicella indica]|uniref:GNAT family N-acetyltransferase n=1 Tax=Crassaminicella indica TaxID=2855394 RepID=A0ABX8RC44_9CLOT|nr:GNAT family N-acetyltransferase [Crassaminicella indica]QXM06376.1 GNAT family N-acetyltransferase [Crassaminicella indica]
MEIKWSKGKEDFKDASHVRYEVFVKEQNVPIELELDEFDDQAYHIVGYENDEAIAVGRILEKESYYLVGRVAVLKEHRGKDYGKVIMENIIKKVEELGGKEIRLHAQMSAKGFYEQLGFEAYGDIFDEAGIEHICMKKCL